MAFSCIRLLTALSMVLLPGRVGAGASRADSRTLPSAASFREDARFLYAGNEKIELIFEKTDGKLYSVKDKASSQEFLGEKNAYWGPYNFLVTVNGTPAYVPGNSAARFSYEAVRGTDSLSLRLAWEQFRVNRPTPLNMRVQITIEIPDSGSLTYWRIAITNGEDLAIQQVAFPIFEGIRRLSGDGSGDYVAYPTMGGALIQNPLKNIDVGRGWGWEMFYPTAIANMQFVAVYSKESRAGLYLAAYDADGYSKYLSVTRPVQDWYAVQVVHRPPVLPRTAFAPGYAMVVGVFSGDWYDAAQIYRNWALQQSWATTASLKRKDGVPEWYKEIALHQWMRSYWDCVSKGQYQEVPQLSREAADLVGAPVTMDWTGWENVAWYINYPKVFPPREGWPSFDKTVADTQELGNRIYVVPCTNLFSSRLAEWPQAKQYAVIDEAGGYPNPFSFSECGLETRFMAMCPATKYWQDELRALIMQLASHKVDHIQLDGFQTVAPPCFARDHGHPPGGGNWFSQAYRSLFERIKTEARQINPQIVFSSEGMAEPFLGLLDSVENPFTTGWAPPAGFELIPLWHAVYHDSALIRSGISTVSGDPQQSAERDYYIRGLARTLVWGEVPVIGVGGYLPNLNAPDEVAMKQYIRKIVQARRTYASPWLVTGRMLRPPTLNVPEIQLPGATNIPYTTANYPPSRSPAVLDGLWKAQNGDSAYVLTNISHNRVSFDLTINPAELELPPAATYEIYQTRNGDYSLVAAAVTLPQTFRIQADPLDIILIGISASSGDASVPRIAPNGVDSAAGYQSGSVSPGELLAIYGSGMGPRELVTLGLDAAGRVANQLAETRVWFDGAPAPLIYVSDRQISGVAPYGTAGKAVTQLQVEYRGKKSKPVALRVSPAQPGIFTRDSSGRGPGAIINQDGTVNSASNPASRGSIVSIYATGEGQTDPEAIDGQITTGTPPRPRASVRVRIDGLEAEILYAGAAPSLVAGVLQVNARVPADSRTGDAIPVVLTVGGVACQGGVTMAVR